MTVYSYIGLPLISEASCTQLIVQCFCEIYYWRSSFSCCLLSRCFYLYFCHYYCTNIRSAVVAWQGQIKESTAASLKGTGSASLALYPSSCAAACTPPNHQEPHPFPRSVLELLVFASCSSFFGYVPVFTLSLRQYPPTPACLLSAFASLSCVWRDQHPSSSVSTLSLKGFRNSSSRSRCFPRSMQSTRRGFYVKEFFSSTSSFFVCFSKEPSKKWRQPLSESEGEWVATQSPDEIRKQLQQWRRQQRSKNRPTPRNRRIAGDKRAASSGVGIGFLREE